MKEERLTWLTVWEISAHEWLALPHWGSAYGGELVGEQASYLRLAS